MAPGVVVNCEKVPFQVTLGVAGYLLNLCEALAKKNRLVFAVTEVGTVKKSPAFPRISAMNAEIVSLEDAKRNGKYKKAGWVELLPHHFQASFLCSKSIIICHDLHIYDVPWKYKNVERIREEFCLNLTSADAVMTEFPRTYFDLETIAGITLMNLFLTETPLLLDTRLDEREEGIEKQRDNYLLYPAQLQLHKGHESLIRASSELKKSGRQITIKCTGSDFNESTTKGLKDLAVELGVADIVRFPGRVTNEELIQMYHDCAGVIIPSQAEGGAYVAFEALCAKKPVAVNRIKAATEHLKMVGADVIWFDATDVASTASAILEVANSDPTNWAARNQVARDRISSMTWENVSDQFQSIIDWLSGRRDRPIMRARFDAWELDCS